MKQYRKKPVVISAIQWDGTEEHAVKISAEDNFEGKLDYRPGHFDGFYIKTLEGIMKVSPMDYVIRGVNGEYYPCKPDIFLKTYDEV